MTRTLKGQIDMAKYNASCKNGFKFDLPTFILHKEKELYKNIEINNNQILRVSIGYEKENESQIPTLHLHKGKSKGNYYSFCGLGQFIPIGEPQKTKRINVLIRLTEKFTDDYILSLQDEKILNNKYIFS